MTKQTQDNMQGWLRSNLWNLIITAVAIIVAFVTIQAKIIALELKTTNLEQRVATYPSQEYFDLRFETIEKGQIDLKEQILEVKKELKQHLLEK